MLIAWALHRGTSVIPKSSNPDRIRANFKAAELALDTDDMVALENLNRNLRVINPSMWLGDYSPYSHESLWCDE